MIVKGFIKQPQILPKRQLLLVNWLDSKLKCIYYTFSAGKDYIDARNRN